MPSWSSLLLPLKKSSKHASSPSSSSSSTSSTSSSTASTPLITPNSSSVSLSPVTQSGNSKGRRLCGRRNRQRVDAQPKPVRPRLTSLFFPASSLTEEQEVQCEYNARYAASCSDLLGGGGGRPVSGRWDQFWDKQTNSSSLDVTTARPRPHSTYLPHSYSVSNLDSYNPLHAPIEEDDPYLTLAPRYPDNRRLHRKSVDYTALMARKERAQSTSGGLGLERGAEIWSSPYDSEVDLLSPANMAPPPIPARSTLRPTASASNLRDRFSRSGSSTPFTLAVDSIPLPSTPGLLTPSTSDQSSSSLPPLTPPALISSPSTESAFSIGRRRRPNIGVRGGSISGDPKRIRDGAASKESSSGVYTPPTFPGAQAQARPTLAQSKVYTPSSFAIPSPVVTRSFVPPPPSPSRSTSVSSTSTASSFGEVTTPRTPHSPLTPSSRFLGAMSGGWGNAMTGIKRASATLSTRSASSPAATSTHAYTPTSAREGFFPSTISETAPSAATSPSAGPRYYGLGLGLTSNAEDTSYMRSRSESSATVSSEKFGGALVGDVPKGKRKPVPKSAGSEEIREEETEVEIVHAL